MSLLAGSNVGYSASSKNKIPLCEAWQMQQQQRDLPHTTFLPCSIAYYLFTFLARSIDFLATFVSFP